jgi:hypothetical protein
LKKTPPSELKRDILQKIQIIRDATQAVSHKVSREKLEVAAEWLKEIHEQSKKLQKMCEEGLE